MACKRIGPFVCLIAYFFIVNNCQVGHCQLPAISSLIQSILPGEPITSLLQNLLSAVICSISPDSCPPKVECSDTNVTYPLIIKNEYICLDKSPSPPLNITYKKDEVMRVFYGENPRISAIVSRTNTPILTGDSLKDGSKNEYSLSNIFTTWKHKYLQRAYIIGNITNPYGQVEYAFKSTSYITTPGEAPPPCNLFVRMIFYMDVRDDEGPSDTGFENFLNNIKKSIQAGSQSSITVENKEYFEPFENTIFKQPYFLYNNATVLYGIGNCATYIVFPEEIHISKSDAETIFGTNWNSTDSNNNYTPEENNLKKAYYGTSGLKTTPS